MVDDIYFFVPVRPNEGQSESLYRIKYHIVDLLSIILSLDFDIDTFLAISSCNSPLSTIILPM